MAPRPLRIVLPATRGPERADEASRRLTAFLERPLARRFEVQIHAATTYVQLAAELLSGRVDVGWAPPLVCARVEAHGGRALLRALRGGSPTFRAAMLRRRGGKVTEALGEGLVGAWSDRDSTSGYLLPRAWIRAQGADPARVFASERFFGSVTAAATEVAEGRADLTGGFASSAAGKRAYSVLDELPEALRDELEAFAFTAEVPNDALVAAPGASAATSRALQEAIATASVSGEGRRVLDEVFDAEGFEPAPPDGYRTLYSLVLESLR